MTWWYWMVLGLVLAAIELATPGGFFVAFLAVSAIVIGLLLLAGLEQPAWVQWLGFTVIALIALRIFRKPLLARLQPTLGGPDVDSMIGEIAIATADLGPDGYGRAELRGSSWQAHNVGLQVLAAGSRCRVIAVNGLVLDVRHE
jgi:membrane protein implicated in regulation of membrane protease activity